MDAVHNTSLAASLLPPVCACNEAGASRQGAAGAALEQAQPCQLEHEGACGVKAQLAQAHSQIASLTEKVDALQQQLAQLLSGGSPFSPVAVPAVPFVGNTQAHFQADTAAAKVSSNAVSCVEPLLSNSSAPGQVRHVHTSCQHGADNGTTPAPSGQQQSSAAFSKVSPSRTLSLDVGEATVPMGATRVVMHQIVLPADGDGLGICFGGQVLSWIDICAGLAAKLVARTPCVTASVDAVHFLKPCRVGSVAIIAAMVNRTFASSMEVGVRVEEEDMRTGERHHCTSAYLTFVALPSQGVARKLPRIVAGNSYHQSIWEAAERRRQERLARRAALRGDPARLAAERERRLQPVTHREGSPTLAPALPVTGMRKGDRHSIPPAVTLAHMTQLIMPQYANSLNITFGGQVMRWMEQCSYIAASRVGRGGYLLTGNMDSIAFTKPTRVGDIMYITAQVTGIFGSSMEVLISVCAETPTVGELFHCGSAYATVVSVDQHGEPVAVPFELAPQSRAERLRCEGAEERRQERLEMRRMVQAQQSRRPSLDGTMTAAPPPADALRPAP